MKALLFAAVFVFFTVTAVNALQCYQCLSTHSWSECERTKNLVTCRSDLGLNRCATIYAKALRDAYAKGCESSSVCSSFCSNPGFSKCQINCCSGDKCNGVENLSTPNPNPNPDTTFSTPNPNPDPNPNPVNALQCYQCLSTYSWSDCERKKNLVTCRSDLGLNRCATIYVKALRDGYGKGCESSSVCSSFCSNPLLSKCQINCCSGDKCNGVATLSTPDPNLNPDPNPNLNLNLNLNNDMRNTTKRNGVVVITSGITTIATTLLVVMTCLL